MKIKEPYVISKIVVVILVCALFKQLVPPLITCLLLAVGYLAYEAYKK